MANQSRRKFMRNSLFGMAALPLGATLLSKHAFAQELEPLDPESPQAQALNYVKVAADASEHPLIKKAITVQTACSSKKLIMVVSYSQVNLLKQRAGVSHGYKSLNTPQNLKSLNRPRQSVICCVSAFCPFLAGKCANASLLSCIKAV